MQSEKQAAKHTEFSIRVKHLAARYSPQYTVYIATYTAGAAGQIYQRIEEGSGEEFWSIKAWAPPPRRRLKDPDVLVTYQRQVKFIVEVKWGVIPGAQDTDLILAPDEWRKMKDLLTGANLCRVRGPAVVDHCRYRGPEFPDQRDYHTNDETKLVLVADLRLTKQCLPEQYAQAMSAWKNVPSNMVLADINARVDEIPSLREVLEG